MYQDSPTELAFKYAVYKINKDPTILANRTLSYDIQYVPREDSFRTTNKVRLQKLLELDKNFILIRNQSKHLYRVWENKTSIFNALH